MRYFLLAALLGGMVMVGACSSRQAGVAPMTEASSHRLAKIGDQEPVVVSLARGETVAPDLVTRTLGNFGSLQLVEMSRGVLEQLPAASELTVWGTSGELSKMDSQLRFKLLQSLAASGWESQTFHAIATFETPTANLERDLNDGGLTLGSLQGGIATLSGAPDALLNLLSRTDLRSLDLPNLLQPSTGR